jgi:hypothetical protein
MKKQKFIPLIALMFLIGACGEKNEPTKKVEKNAAEVLETIVYKTEQEYLRQIGRPENDASLVARKKFGDKVNSQRMRIQIDDFLIGVADKSLYPSFGEVYIYNNAYRLQDWDHSIQCKLTKEQSDRFMEKNIQGRVKMTGIISAYSSGIQLNIHTCTIESIS